MNRTHLGFGLSFAAAAAAFATQSCTVPGLAPVPEFHLEGVHGDIACGACHIDNLEAALPRDCLGCHLDDRPPDHFPGDCANCHTSTDWDDAEIDHSIFLSLAGGHTGLDCTDCHAPDTFEGLDRACESCHEPDRPANHASGPCAICHPVSAWEDGVFDHDPVFPTPHEGVSACADCHPNDQNFGVFTCTDCHEHRQSAMNGEHDEISNYVWDSDQCYRCHPRGRE